MTILVQNVKQYAFLTVTVIYKCNLIEELGVRLWNVRTSLNTLNRLVIDKSKILVSLQVLLNVSTWGTDDVYVDDIRADRPVPGP